MAPSSKRSLWLLLCRSMLRVAGCLVPPSQREGWRQEWQSEIFHRHQFLLRAGCWSKREAFLLCRRCCGAFPDALWHVTAQEQLRVKLRERIRSPLMCLASIVAAIVLLGILTRGLPAFQNLLRTGTDGNNARLLFIWFHPSAGGGDEGIPPDAVTAWAARSKLLESVAPFVVGHPHLKAAGVIAQPLLVRTQASFFRVLGTKPLLGVLPTKRGVVLTHSVWKSLYREDRRALGAEIQLGRDVYHVSAILPDSFSFLSRQPSVYLVQDFLSDAQVMVVGRIKQGVTEKSLDRELTRIAESACYYFFRAQLRFSFFREAAWIPCWIFVIAASASGLLVLLVSRVPLRRLLHVWRSNQRLAVIRRVAFFLSKVLLAFLFVFALALEWSRSESAILFGSRDPAAGPFLLWAYIVGTMGVLFWSVADQRARCRVCLRLLCFPVRVGCPGCLLLNWSGTELFCPEGHGLMHVPDLAPSWDEEAERWISLDDSWKSLFIETR